MLQRKGARTLAERAVAEGHWVRNLSMTHTTPLGAGLEPDEVAREIEESQALLGDLSHERRFFVRSVVAD